MSATPAVSVILPTYNRERTLRRAIDSVLAQSFADFELIVVDDCSTDATASLLAQYREPRLRVLYQPRNAGAAAARNAGIAVARGEWLAFQDSDDEWLPGKLALQLAAACAAAPGTGLVLASYWAQDEDGRRVAIRPRGVLAGRGPAADLLDGWPIITPVWLVRASVLRACGGFPPEYAVFEDWDLVFRIADACGVAAVAEPVLVKHGSRDTLCADPLLMRDALQKLLDGHRHRWQRDPRQLARRLAHLGCLQFHTGQRAAGRRTLAQALARAPLPPIAALLWLASLGGGRVLRRVERLFPHFAGGAYR